MPQLSPARRPLPRASFAGRLFARASALTAAGAAAALIGASGAGAAAPPVVDLERATVDSLEDMMATGELSSEQLTALYINRIAALNNRAAGLNAVRSLNPRALEQARALDAERAASGSRGPLHGIPVLVKDNLDYDGLPTTAGSVALEHSYPSRDSTVVANLRRAGAVILGKTNLGEFANYTTTGMPAGYSSLGGQVLNAYDTTVSPRGSSSGSGVAAAAGLAAITIGTETSGSIIGPATASGVVGLRPTVGLVSRAGIIPISASQDTAGPIVRTVADAAATLYAIAGPDPEDGATDGTQPGSIGQPARLPDYMAALDAGALRGTRIATVNDPEPKYQAAIRAIQAAGAVTVQIATPTATAPPAILDFEFKRDMNHYLDRLPDDAPRQSFQDIIDYNNAHAQEALKFGQVHFDAANLIDLSDPATRAEYEADRDGGQVATRAAIDDALQNGTPGDTSDDFAAIMTPSGTLTSTGARAGYPQLTVPAGYSDPGRLPVNISFVGTAYSEARLLALGYAYEQTTRLRRPPSELNTNLFRCARTSPLSAFAGRGDCNPGAELLELIGEQPQLPFSIETAGIPELERRMQQGTLDSVTLTKAYMARIAHSNATGPTTNAVRSINPMALQEAAQLDAERRAGSIRGPLHGMPVLLKDNVDAVGMPTTAGSIALQTSYPDSDAPLTRRLREAGAVILGKANLNEFAGYMSDAAPSGYSTLGGQVLNPNNGLLTPRGSSNGSAVAAATGLAAATIGTDTSGSIVSPAVANGVVGLRPTQGLVSRTGIVPISSTQDTAGPITRTVADAAYTLEGIAGPDPEDPATTGDSPGSTAQPPTLPDYVAALDRDALDGAHIAVIDSDAVGYDEAIAVLRRLGADVEEVPTPALPSAPGILGYELKRDMNAYLDRLPTTAPIQTLADIVAYNSAHPAEALKYGQELLTAGEAVDLSDPTTRATYEAARDLGIQQANDGIDETLENGTPGDGSDDFDALFFPGRDLRAFASVGGYPLLTIPAGYDDSIGRDPVNVSFISTPYTEDRLIGYGYAYEQASLMRRPPSFINPSMWRCVPGGEFGSRSCAPGEFVSVPDTPDTPEPPAAPAPPAPPEPPAAPAPPAPPTGRPAPRPSAVIGRNTYRSTVAGFLRRGVRIQGRCVAVGRGTIALTVGGRAARRAGLSARRRSFTLASATVRCRGGRFSVLLRPTARARRALRSRNLRGRSIGAQLTLRMRSGRVVRTDRARVTLRM
ncbi:amidase family protein [Conexibacter sp. CPCC 206217]|uniref:amidase family protein n=1 Tax=Conexibacter sp. CPCC 206217 TaxID=3064574 RepID=UPI00272243DF|nr:amidase family protein [Conexibacter sp. CPCC 206217]MDO8210154.1 amidase family protein [Conexibacter sp. CPCC 206217]